MKKFALAFLLTCLTFQTVYSRISYKVTGKILDRYTRQPVIGASVQIVGTPRGAVVDDNGRFEINRLADSVVTVRVSMIGYDTVVREVSFDGNRIKDIKIILQPVDIPVDKITVTASRFAEEKFTAPSNISITFEEKFDERTFSTTAEVLREEPGVLVQKTTAAHGAPIIRGLIGRYILLLYDGIRLSKPTFRFGANQYMNTVDLESLDRIEIFRGPSSVMYGSDAIGGAVNLIPSLQPMGGSELVLSPSFTSHFSSYDEGRSVNFSLKGDYRRLSASFALSYKKFCDLRAGGDIGKQSPTGWEEGNFNSRVRYALTDNASVSLDYITVRQKNVPRYDKYVSGDFEEYIYDPQDRDLAAVTYELNDIGSFIKSFKGNLSYQRESEGKTTRKTSSAKVMEYEDRLTTWGGYAQASAALSTAHRLTFGFEFYYDRINSEGRSLENGIYEDIRPTYPDNTEYYQAGVFFQDKWSLRENVQLVTGLRYSRVDMDSPLEQPFGRYEETFHDLTGSAALSYQPVSKVNLIGRWSRGFRAPNLNDAVVLKYSSSGVDAPSTDLDPEYSNNYELGVKVENGCAGGSLFLFYNQLNDLIDRVPGEYNGLTFFDEDGDGVQDSTEYDIYQRYNVDRARIYGFEFEGTLRPGFRWELRANGFWTRGDNQSAGEPMSRIPPLMGLLAARYKPAKNMWVEVMSRLAGEQTRLSQRDIEDTRIDPLGTPDWVTVNLKYHLEFERISFNLMLENIFDKTYKEHGSGIYSPGRGVVITLRYDG